MSSFLPLPTSPYPGYLSPNKYLQFIKLPLNYDPDSYINQFSYNNFITILKKPISIIDFIFEQSSSSIAFLTGPHELRLNIEHQHV